jgi:hypothetical protein
MFSFPFFQHTNPAKQVFSRISLPGQAGGGRLLFPLQLIMAEGREEVSTDA